MGRRVVGKNITPRVEIVTDFVKLEVEEHELEDDPVWTISETHVSEASTDSDSGRPYTTSSNDQRSRVRGNFGRERRKTAGKRTTKCDKEGD